MGQSSFEGLWQQLESSNKREYVAFTGSAGMKAFSDALADMFDDKAIRRRALVETLQCLKGIIPEDYYKSIYNMIQSPDEENWIVAESLMQNLKVQ